MSETIESGEVVLDPETGAPVGYALPLPDGESVLFVAFSVVGVYETREAAVERILAVAHGAKEAARLPRIPRRRPPG